MLNEYLYENRKFDITTRLVTGDKMTTLNNTGDKITTLITNCVSFVFSPDSIMQKIYFRLSAAN